MKKQKGYAIGAVVLVAIILIVIFMRPKGMSIIPNEYVKVTCSGLNGEGKARISFDAQSFLNDIKAEKKLKPAQESEIQGLLANADQYFQLSKNEELSNGDELSIESSMPSDFFKPYKIKIKNDDVTYTVAGLTDMQILDLTQYGVTEFKGFEGHGYVNAYMDYEKLYHAAVDMVKKVDDSEQAERYITDELYDDLYQSVINVSASKYEDISNGDKITVTYSVNEEHDRIEKYGIVFQGGEVEWKAEGLEEVETINLEDYLTAEFRGYNGAGELSVSIDYEKLSADLSEKIPDKRNDLTLQEVVSQIESYISYYFDLDGEKTSGISNGDEIRIFAETEESQPYISVVGFEVKSGEKNVTAEGLEEPQEVDLMDILNISFSGICPSIDVEKELDMEHPLYNYLDEDSYYEIPYEISAQNGDTLDITLEYDEEAALRAGYKVTNNEKSYEISGLDTYNFTLESVDAENLQSVEKDLKEQIHSILLNNENELLENLTENKGLILWNQVKTGLNKIVKVYAEHSYYDGNKVAFVYEATVPVMGQDENVSYYSVSIVNYLSSVVEKADGSLDVTEDNMDGYEIFYSEESLEEALTEMEDSFGVEEGTEREITAVTNEKLEEELKNDESEKETQKSNIPEASPAESMAVIPEISKEASDRAAAMIEYDGHRYYRFDTAVTWKEAKELCEKAGGSLVTITSWTEQSVIKKLVEDGTLEQYWIGATDETLEGQWRWTTGEEAAYNGWYNNQPDNYDEKEHYACSKKAYDCYWNDAINEEEETGYILEVWDQQMETAQYLAESDTLIHQNEVSYDSYDEDSYGNFSYGVIAYNTSQNGWTQYKLNGEYEKLSGETAVYAEAESGVSMDFAVFGDGKLLYRQSSITRQSAPQSFAVDVSGVQTLTIAVRNMGEYSYNGYLLLNKAKLYQADQKVVQKVDRIQKLDQIDAREYQFDLGLWQDALGNLHDGYKRFDAAYDSYAAWNLDKKYQTFSGKFVLGKDTGADVSLKVQVYGDEELLFESSGYDKTKDVLEFSLDVTDKKVLKIVTDDEKEGRNAYLYLVDDLLTGSAESEAQTEKEEEPKESEATEVTAWDMADTQTEAVPEPSETSDTVDKDTVKTYKKLAEIEDKIAASESYEYQEKIYDSHGKEYVSSYVLDASYNAWVTYDLDGMYTEISGILSTYEDTEENANLNIGFFGDGKLLYTVKDISGWEKAMPFTVDVTGVKKLTIKTSNTGEYSYGWLLLNDTILKEAGKQTINGEAAHLENQQLVDSSDMEYESGLFKNAYGEIYEDSYCFYTSNNGFAVYLLDGKYTEFSGVVCTGGKTNSEGTGKIQIYSDDELIFEQDGITKMTETIPFTLDVTGKKNLKIIVSNSSEEEIGAVYLAGDLLR